MRECENRESADSCKNKNSGFRFSPDQSENSCCRQQSDVPKLQKKLFFSCLDFGMTTVSTHSLAFGTLKWRRTSSSSQRSVSVSTLAMSGIFVSLHFYPCPSNGIMMPKRTLIVQLPYFFLKIFLLKNRLWEERFNDSVVFRYKTLQHVGRKLVSRNFCK